MSTSILPFSAAVADDRRAHHSTGAFNTRPLGDYIQHGSYVSYSQASSRAYFGTMPVYDISTSVPPFQDEALYGHPDAMPNGLVAAADEYAVYEPTPWCGGAGYSSGAPPSSVPLTAQAIAYQASQVAQSCEPQQQTISSPATSLHINTDVTYAAGYRSPQQTSTAVSPTQAFSPISVQDSTSHYSTLSPTHEAFYTLSATDYNSASTTSTVDPGDQPFIFSPNPQPFHVSSPISPSAAYGSSWDTGGDESMLYASGYETYSSSQALRSSTALAVPTPRAAAVEDVPERLERYVSDSPDATPAPQHVPAFASDRTHVAPQHPHNVHGHPSMMVNQHDGHGPCWVPYPHGHSQAANVVVYGSASAHSAPPSMFHSGGQASTSTFTGTAHYQSNQVYSEAPSPTSVSDASARAKKGRRRKRTPEPRKPLIMACLFCRGRKIACGPPPPGSDDRSCDQCKRRDQPCEYPLECRRGQRKVRSDRSITADDDERGRSVAPTEGERRLAPAPHTSMPWSSS